MSTFATHSHTLIPRNSQNKRKIETKLMETELYAYVEPRMARLFKPYGNSTLKRNNSCRNNKDYIWIIFFSSSLSFFFFWSFLSTRLLLPPPPPLCVYLLCWYDCACSAVMMRLTNITSYWIKLSMGILFSHLVNNHLWDTYISNL